jgi:3-deoxy-D-manno-octulosonic acid (KDO) 8-phosphate synthase
VNPAIAPIETMSGREELIEDLAAFGVGAGVMVAPFVLYAPPRTAHGDRAAARALDELRPLLNKLARRRRVIR